MNRAGSVTEFDRAVRGFAQPHQNVVFASVEGRIGYRLAGRVPGARGVGRIGSGRIAERMGGRLPWQPGRRPLHPSGFGSDRRGSIACANNLQAPGLGTAISTDYAAPFRAQRISRPARGSSTRLGRRGGLRAAARYVQSSWAIGIVLSRSSTARRMGQERSGRLGSRRGMVRVDTGLASARPCSTRGLYRLRSLIAADEFAEEPGVGRSSRRKSFMARFWKKAIPESRGSTTSALRRIARPWTT